MAKREAKEKKKGGLPPVITLIIVIIGIGFLGTLCPNKEKLAQNIDRSKQTRTQADMKAIGTALGSFKTDNKAFPVQETESDLNRTLLPSKYYEGTLDDAWKTSFKYWSDGKSYKLTSYGNDMKKGGSNDFDIDIVYSDGNFVQP